MMIQNVKCRGYESSPHLGSSLRGPGELGGGRRLATEYASGSGKFAAAAGVVCGGGLCVLCILRRPLDFAWYYSLGRARTHTHCVPLFAVVCMWHTHKHTHTHANTHKYTHTHQLSLPPPFPPSHTTNCSRVLFRRQGRSEYWSITLLVHEQPICV